jgi:hypothetical protein
MIKFKNKMEPKLVFVSFLYAFRFFCSLSCLRSSKNKTHTPLKKCMYASIHS